jgi:hypothetical protein
MNPHGAAPWTFQRICSVSSSMLISLLVRPFPKHCCRIISPLALQVAGDNSGLSRGVRASGRPRLQLPWAGVRSRNLGLLLLVRATPPRLGLCLRRLQERVGGDAERQG